MNKNFWEAEQFWTQMHCTSTILDKITKKRKSYSQKEKNILYRESGILSLSYSNQENINNFLDLITTRHFKLIAKIMIEDMYRFEFDNCSSVDSQSTLSLNKRLDKLASVSLMQHTFGVVNQLFKKITKRYGIYSDLFYLAALAHDSGKCLELKKFYSIDLSVQHHVASADYIRRVALLIEKEAVLSRHNQDLIKAVCEVLEAHHSPDNEKMFHSVHGNEESKIMHITMLEKLKEADSSQRAIELEMLK